ncbi:MAG: choice-of-anchor M domain-containing protein [Pirellulaceae bacterium]
MAGNRQFGLAFLLLAAWSIWTTTTAFADVYVLGHADIGVGFEAGQLHLHLHAEDELGLYGGGILPAGEYEPGDPIIGVPGPSIGRPAGNEWSFLSANAGDPIWFLPQGSDPNKPFLGISSSELKGTDGWTTVSWSLVSISTILGAPADVSIWQAGAFGAPNLLASTRDPAADVWTRIVGGHDHQNIGFNGEGIYDVVLRASAVNNGSAGIAAGTYIDQAAFRFATGSFTAIPEPSSLFLVCAAAAGVARRRWRSARKVAG